LIPFPKTFSSFNIFCLEEGANEQQEPQEPSPDREREEADLTETAQDNNLSISQQMARNLMTIRK
jgi:hypothetical protein